MAVAVRANMLDPDLTQEAVLAGGGFRRIAGVDEAGRGAWAGPLVAAAVVLPEPTVLDVGSLAGVRDSKLLTHAQRDELFEVVVDVAVDAGVGWSNADEVDLLGLTAANELAMVRAVRALGVAPDHLLVDAFRLRSIDLPQRAIIHGDRICLSIAAIDSGAGMAGAAALTVPVPVTSVRAVMRQATNIVAEAGRASRPSGLGLVVVERNVRLPGGEIDLVAREADELVFVEVKTRIGDDSTAPDLAVTASKLARLERLAEAYLSRAGDEDAPWRVDVVAIVIERSGRVLRLDHLRGAYL